ncbi:MAG: sulfite dehydrogenase [Bryobacteraceae bacterium]|nr:sulfite dehydrogenase [Bryobacteraceae bacterium]
MKKTTRRQALELGAALGTAMLAKAEEPRTLGKPLSGYGERSAFVKSARATRVSKTPEAGSSSTPLAETYGIITPSSLHYERHHAGVPAIDPAAHRLTIHGLVERPLVLTMDEIRRLPSVSRIHFLECGGNSGSEWAAKNGPTVQRSCGLASCSEWTGVPLRLLLEEVGLKPDASWLIAEGADACRMQRSVPIVKALDDALLAYGQNGEPLRPEQGFPLRLLTPGWEGNVQVKWLRRLHVTSQPYMTRDETSKYSDLMPDGKARIFTLTQEAKSVVTFPSGGQTLAGPGLYEITGLAWTGRGRIERVELTLDGGRTWEDARLDEPRFRLAFTRFRLPWRWDGKPAVIASRATDESGYVQPTREQLIAARGTNSGYHFNGIKFWRVADNGSVANVEA